MYDNKYDARKDGNYSCINRVRPSVKNMFVSSYEYVEETSSWFSKIGGSMLKLAGGMFSIASLLPQARVEITS